MRLLVILAVFYTGTCRTMLRSQDDVNEDSPMENEELVEGDIIQERSARLYNAITSDSKRWPKRTVPYVVDSSLKSNAALIREAMDHIESRTSKCVRFTPRKGEKDFVRIAAKTGCSSLVGRKGGEQVLSLGTGCDRFGIVVHELTHALGFDHEHMRFDRDSHIRVFLENVKPKFKDQFKAKKSNEHRLFTPFDYSSIMLYGSRAFAISRSKPSMTRLNGDILPETSQKKGLSDSDVARIRQLYGC